MLIDLHVHTIHSSCGHQTLAQAIAAAQEAGLDGICITDHHCTVVQDDLEKHPAPSGFKVFVGYEYSTVEGDFLIYGVAPVDIPPLLSAYELLLKVIDLGGIAVAAHPCRFGKVIPEDIFIKGLCRHAELFNGRNTVPENDLASLLCGRYNLTATAGSDAHAPHEIGRFATRFTDDITNMNELVSAIANGECSPERLPQT